MGMYLKRIASLILAGFAFHFCAASAHASQYKLTFFQSGTFIYVDPVNPWGVPEGNDLDFSLSFWFMLPLDSEDADPGDNTHSAWTVPGGAQIEAAGVTANFNGPAMIDLSLVDNGRAQISYDGLAINLEVYNPFNPFLTDSASNLLDLAGRVISYVDVGGSYNDAEGLRLVKVESVPESGATVGLLAFALASCFVARYRK
jgi:hypothetical protein